MTRAVTDDGDPIPTDRERYLAREHMPNSSEAAAFMLACYREEIVTLLRSWRVTQGALMPEHVLTSMDEVIRAVRDEP